MVAAMSLSAAATLLVVPPMNLLGLAAAGAAALFWRPRLGRALVVAAVAGLIVLGMPIVADALVASLERGLPVMPDPAHPPRAIVILGGDVARRAGDGSDIGPLSLERVRAGAALARRTGLPILVTGGVTYLGGAPVGQVMADSLQTDFQLRARWIERVSDDTWENAAMSAPMLAQDGVDSVYLVTHGWHMRRVRCWRSRTYPASLRRPRQLGAECPGRNVASGGFRADSVGAAAQLLRAARVDRSRPTTRSGRDRLALGSRRRAIGRLGVQEAFEHQQVPQGRAMVAVAALVLVDQCRRASRAGTGPESSICGPSRRSRSRPASRRNNAAGRRVANPCLGRYRISRGTNGSIAFFRTRACRSVDPSPDH